MQLPFHPIVVHFPLALTFIMPVLIIVFALMIKMNKMQPQTWLIIIGLQLAVVVSGYVALESGEAEEDKVEKVVGKKLIHEHEEAAEIFVGSTVLVLVLSIAVFFIRKDIGFAIKLGIAGLGLVSCYLAYQTGHLGGEMVYGHGAASAYTEEHEPQGILPTPGIQTSESPNPADDNESLKADDNDYGNSDDEAVIDDESKQED
jgi:uncharacterized membrane protein